MQETKVRDSDFPRQAFEDEGYHVVFRGEKSYNGVAVATAAKPDDVGFGLDDGGPADETRLAYVRLGAVHIVNTYVPQGREIDHPMYAYKLQWFRRLRAYFDRHFSPRMKVMWAGDMNVAPEAMDVHNAARQADHVCYHEAVRKAFAETAGWGFADVFRKHHPEPGHYSFFDYRLPNAVALGRGWRVDHLMATVPLARSSRDCFIDVGPRKGPRPSDHTFVAADFGE
jgi:exodeoxyribonuclease-3